MLADEIIDAATSLLLDSEAASAVSIRAVADRVGVTPPSIYLHFDDKDALLEAVCARYFERLDEELAAASKGIDDPLERALQMGIAYVRFAVATPVLYREAFHHVSPVAARSKVDEVLAASAFVRFTGTVSELADAVHMRVSTVSRQIARLIDDGEVEKIKSDGDGRHRLVRLTEQGRATLHEHVMVRDSVIRRHVIDVLSPEEFTALGDVFRRIRAAIPGCAGE